MFIIYVYYYICLSRTLHLTKEAIEDTISHPTGHSKVFTNHNNSYYNNNIYHKPLVAQLSHTLRGMCTGMTIRWSSAWREHSEPN